jgi:hypothetical protein
MALPQKLEIAVAKQNKTKQIFQSFSNSRLGWSKEPQPISAMILFGQSFY